MIKQCKGSLEIINMLSLGQKKSNIAILSRCILRFYKNIILISSNLFLLSYAIIQTLKIRHVQKTAGIIGDDKAATVVFLV